MNRRFLYMLVRASPKRGSYTLRRTNPSRLFYPRDSPERAAAAAAAAGAGKAATSQATMERPVEDARLPPPTTSFRCYSTETPHFALLGRKKDKILVVDENEAEGRAVLYDDASRSIHVLPSPRGLKTEPFSVAVGDKLYLMDGMPEGVDEDSDEDERSRYAATVEALVPGGEDSYWWRSVPPPPYAAQVGYSSDQVTACAAVGESSIWVSTLYHGTLALDTASGTWSRAGDWALPFQGNAEHVPEHGGLWFRFLHSGRLHAWDLRAEGGPTARRTCGHIADMADWLVVESEVAHLGDGRLCIGRLFKDKQEESDEHCSCCRYHWRPSRFFAMFTGVEVVQDAGDGRLHLIEHKSCRYSLGEGMSAQFVF